MSSASECNCRDRRLETHRAAFLLTVTLPHELARRPLTPSLSPSDGERVADLSSVALAKAEGRVRGGSWSRCAIAKPWKLPMNLAQSFAERLTVQRMVEDCIDTLKAMNLKVAFLPLGVCGDLVKQPGLRPAILERLRAIAPKAEQAGVIIGLETALSAAEEVKLLDDVGSPAVRSYFNFANALKAGRDLHAELRALGKDYLCQIQCTDEDGVLLQDNQRLDLRAVKRTLDEMGWSGWLLIERSRDAKDPRNVKKNFGANTAYVKSVFQTG